MGRMETGHHSISDPAMANHVVVDDEHPLLPESITNQPPWWETQSCIGHRNQYKSVCKDSCRYIQDSNNPISVLSYLLGADASFKALLMDW